ncbi:MAG: hypothetical protein PH343_05200 [Nitrospira sp.]|nr:hypothetical protein [Nitrospira sp.]
MSKSASNQFHAALSYLLKKEGRGSQTRLSNQQSIDRGYLNAIIKGRKPGSEDVREKIASHFNLAYEEMLVLGRTLLEGDEGAKEYAGKCPVGTADQEVPTVFSQIADKGERVSKIKPIEKAAKNEYNISDKIRKVVAILESDTSHRDILAELIDVFYAAVDKEKDKVATQNQMQELESRLADVERQLAEEKSQYRESA